LTEFTGISKLKHGQTLKIQIRYWNILNIRSCTKPETPNWIHVFRWKWMAWEL
jgi:hypothetical protein